MTALAGASSPKPIIVDHTMLPDSDGRPVDNFLQVLLAELLTDPLRPWLAQRHPTDDFVLGRDSGIYWRQTDPPLDGCKAPDWFYVPNVPPMPQSEYRRSYVLWVEGVIPLIAIEFVSGNGSEERDTTPVKGKFWVYERAIGIPYYVIFYPTTGAVEAYGLIQGLYKPLAANERGHWPIERMGLELGIWKGKIDTYTGLWLRWFDANGNPLLSSKEQGELDRQRADRLAEKLRELGFDQNGN